MSINPGLFSSDTDQHNTPKWLAGKIAAFLGGIELDPCTNPGNPCGAKLFFTEQDDGLGKAWHARTVYMNPPYGREINDWVWNLNNQYELGLIQQAIALLPARTDTQWWQIIKAHPACFIRGRLKFNDCKGSAPFPSVLIYLGNNWFGFMQAFEDIGQTYIPFNSKRVAA